MSSISCFSTASCQQTATSCLERTTKGLFPLVGSLRLSGRWGALIGLFSFALAGAAPTAVAQQPAARSAAKDKKDKDAKSKRRPPPPRRKSAKDPTHSSSKFSPLRLPGSPMPKLRGVPKPKPGKRIPGQPYTPLAKQKHLFKASGKVPGGPARRPRTYTKVAAPERPKRRRKVRPPPRQRKRRAPKKDKELERIKRQLRADPIPIPPRLGAIFVPNITRQENVNPTTYAIFDKRGQQVAVARTGKKSFVFPGWYTVKIGGQATDRLPRYKVFIKEGKLTVIRPRWAALIVRVVDERLIQFRGTYDIIHLKSRRSVGTGIGADDTLGEKVKPWLLQPGQYMIVRVGDSHLARTSYFTVELNQGKVTHFRLVADKNSGNFQGGGVRIKQNMLGSFNQNSKWQFSLQLNGNFLWNQIENVQGSPSGHSFSLTTFLFGRLAYNAPRHFFLLTLNTELGFTIPSQGDLRKSSDKLELQAIYILRLLRFFGPYVRAGIEVSMFPDFFIFGPDDERLLQASSVFLCNDKSCRILQQSGPGRLKQFKLSGVFDPFALRQGIGINLQAVQQSFLNLRILAGLGFRQEIDREVFQFSAATDLSDLRCRDANKRNPKNPLDLTGCPKSEEQESHTTIRLFEQVSTHREGIELALVATGQISRFVTFTTEFDALIQFNLEAFKLDIDWRTSVTLRLSHYASIIYRLRVRRNSALLPTPGSPELSLWSIDQSLLLSFSLLL